MFEKLEFKNEKERKSFEKFKLIKGEYLHKQIYNVLLELHNNEKVTYYELSSYVRFDKNLRDLLYKYLATFEENIKANLCRKYDVNQFKIYKKENYKDLFNDLIENNGKEESNLYFGLKLELFQLLDIYEKKFDVTEIVKKQLESVRMLRNDVMHHSLLLFGNSKNLEETNENIFYLSKQLNALYLLLPKEYRVGFEKDINLLNYDEEHNPKFVMELCLGVMKNGIC